MAPQRKNAKISDENRKALVKKHEAGEDWVKLASDLGINRTTAYMIIKKGSYAKSTCGGRREKLVKETADSESECESLCNSGKVEV